MTKHLFRNYVITSSIDRCIKIWNINYIFEKSHHIDRNELPIDKVGVSTDAGIAVVVTRNCIGIWDLLTGRYITHCPFVNKLMTFYTGITFLLNKEN